MKNMHTDPGTTPLPTEGKPCAAVTGTEGTRQHSEELLVSNGCSHRSGIGQCSAENQAEPTRSARTGAAQCKGVLQTETNGSDAQELQAETIHSGKTGAAQRKEESQTETRCGDTAQELLTEACRYDNTQEHQAEINRANKAKTQGSKKCRKAREAGVREAGAREAGAREAGVREAGTRQTGATRTGLRTWILPFFRQYRRALFLALFLGVTTFVFASALMFNSGYLISKAAEAPGNIMAIHLPVMLARIFGVGKPILHYLERLTSHDWILRMTSSMRLKLYTVLEKDAIFFKQHYRTGDILGLLAEDIGHIQNLYLRSVFPTLVAWILYVLLIVALGFFSVWFALFMLLFLGVIIFLVPLVSVLINGARQAERKAQKNALYEQLTDNILGVSDWIISGRASSYVNTYRCSEASLRSIDAKLNRSARRRNLVLQVLFAGVLVSLLLWAGSEFGGSFAGPANWIAAFVLGFFPLIDAFSPLSEAAVETSRYRDSIDRLGALPQGTRQQGEPVSKLEEPIVLESRALEFSYPGARKPVLKGIDLTIQPGEKLAVLGRSGAGKSTFASLLRGDLMPSHGSLTLNGVPTASFGDDITAYIGVIQQRTYLFNTSLADNLRIGNREATDEDLWQALKQVGLADMVRRLPDRLDTLVDEAGLRFSGGERHRIALARVLLQKVPIVVLDEPTVGLDPLTEQALLATIFETMKNKTVILITHHLKGVHLMDRVVFIEDGKIFLSGSPKILEKTSTFYQRLQAFDRGFY